MTPELEQAPCCAHLWVDAHVTQNDNGTCSDVWRCRSCPTEFVPRSDLEAARAEVAEMTRQRDGIAKIAAGYKLQLDVGFQGIERTLAMSDDDKIKELRSGLAAARTAMEEVAGDFNRLKAENARLTAEREEIAKKLSPFGIVLDALVARLREGSKA